MVRAETRLAELKLRLMRIAEQQDESATVAMSGTDAWLAALTGSPRAVMAGGLWLARMLAEHYPAVRLAFARGDLAEKQARVIVAAAEKMPTGVSDSQRDLAVADVVARAVEQRLDPAGCAGSHAGCWRTSQSTSPTSTRRSSSSPRNTGPAARPG